jgi:radical SAM protein with 4Fe4S-binding SPASM domain
MRHLSAAFSYVGNTATGRGYVVSQRGRCSVVNLDALELLTSGDPAWQVDPAYRSFVQQCVAARWLVEAAPAQPASVRWVDRAIHLRRIQYEVNLVCNLECAHCYCSSSPRAPVGQSTAFVLEIVRQAAAMGVIYFDITGGEPLVRDDITEIIAAIRAHGMVPGLFTNGTLVTADRAAALQRAGLSAAQISLDARTPALHDELRGKAGAFDRAVRGVRRFQQAGVPVRINVCLNRRNAHETGEIVRFLRDDLKVPFGLDRVIQAGRGHGHAVPLALDNSEYYALIREHLLPGEQLAAKACDAVSVDHGAYIEPGCGVGASYLFIKHDGRAALCPTLTEAESHEFAHADLARMSLAQAWEHHPTFQRFRGVQCENATRCPAGKRCRGGCRSNAYLIEGRLDAPDELHCNVEKNGAPGYRRMIDEYDEHRARGLLPARPASREPAPVRRLPVLA